MYKPFLSHWSSAYTLLLLLTTAACRTTGDDPSSRFRNDFGSIRLREPDISKDIQIYFKGQVYKINMNQLDIAANEKPLPSFSKTYLSSMDETKFQVDAARLSSSLRLEGLRDSFYDQSQMCFSFIFDDYSQDILIFKESKSIGDFLRSGTSPIYVNLTGNLCLNKKFHISRIVLDSRYNSKNMIHNLSYMLNIDQVKDPASLIGSNLSKFYQSLGLPMLIEKKIPGKPGIKISPHLGEHNLFRKRVWKTILDSSRLFNKKRRKRPSNSKEQWKLIYQRSQFASVRHNVKLTEVLLTNELSKRSLFIAGSHAYLKTPLPETLSKKLKKPGEFTLISPIFDGNLAESKTWDMIEIANISYQEIIDQFTKALGTLHSQQLIHGNLQLDNILFDSSNKKILLTDLRYSKNFQAGVLAKKGSSHTSKSYQAHEIRDNKAFDPFKAEVYSWGLIALEIKLGGKRPILGEDFKIPDHKDSKTYLPKTKPSYRGALVASKKISLKDPLDKLIFSALNPKPLERPTISEILTSLNQLPVK